LYLYFYCDADTFQLQAPNKDALLPQCMKGLSGASECSIYTCSQPSSVRRLFCLCILHTTPTEFQMQRGDT
jgi:hypothetical protein